MEPAIEKHDWAGLARALEGVAPDIARGEMPSDPDLLRAYLEALLALRDLAREVGTPATVREVARDPRTGPFLFAAALRQSWPDAPEQDIETATEVARAAMDEYGDAVAGAATPAERAAAETVLVDALNAEVTKLSERHGSPIVAPPVGSKSGSADEPEARPEESDAVQPSDVDDQTIRATATTNTVLRSAGITPVADRIYRGTPERVAAQVVEGWSRAFEIPDRQVSALPSVVERWVRSYRRVLAAAEPKVVRAFEAGLGRGVASSAVAGGEIRSLRDALLSLQIAAERAVLDLGASAVSSNSPRTFFLFD